MLKLKWIVILPNQTYNITTYNIFNNLSFTAGLMDLKARFKKDNLTPSQIYKERNSYLRRLSLRGLCIHASISKSLGYNILL